MHCATQRHKWGGARRPCSAILAVSPGIIEIKKCMCYEIGILLARHAMLITCFDFLFGQLALAQETHLVGFEPLLCVPSILSDLVPRRNDWRRKMSAHLAQCNLIGFMWVYFHPSQVSCTRSAAFHVLPSVHLSLPPLGDCWGPAGGCWGAAGELLEDCWRLLGDYWRTAGGLLGGC